MSLTGTYRYVRKPLVELYEAHGWIDCGECPAHHGHWSHLMRACECNPEGVKPEGRE